MVATTRGRIGALAWLMIFRLLLGVANVVDGLAKLHLFQSPASVSDFQPSPLGAFSGLLQLVAGLFVFVGLETRIACAVLAAHLALGLLLVKADGGDPWSVPNFGPNAWFIIATLIGGGAGLSVDSVRPAALRRYLRARKPPSAAP